MRYVRLSEIPSFHTSRYHIYLLFILDCFLTCAWISLVTGHSTTLLASSVPVLLFIYFAVFAF